MGGGNSKHKEAIGSGKAKAIQNAPATTNPVPELPEAKIEAGEESKCPMHREDGSYSWDWRQMFRAAAIHGPKGSKPLSKEQQEAAKNASPTMIEGCPVKHDTSKSEGGCPVKASAHPEYNVYSEPIDRSNQMPKGVKTQLPTSTQRLELSTDRVSSSISKGGGDESSTATWTYPSPQQFYNALARKGKLDDDTSEDDMESVVALHNNMNEKTWAKVVEWEKQTYNASSSPKLLKFKGRPHDLSPKATLKHYLLGHPLPYDRHDWTILRDDGTTVRYVIDYYYDETKAQESSDSALPDLHDRDGSPCLLVDVRPALDGPSQFAARALQMPYKIWNKETEYEQLPLRGTPEMTMQVKESVEVWQSIQQSRKQQLEREEETSMESMIISDKEAKEIAVSFAKVLRTCKVQQQKVNACDSEEECSRASMDLTMCMGPILCPVQQKGLLKTLESDDDAKIEAALETLTECVVLQTAKRQLAKEQHPKAFPN